MKKFVSAVLAVLLIMTLASCGGQESPDPQQESEPQSEQAVGLIAAPEYPEGIGYEDFDAQYARRTENAVNEDFVKAVQEFSCSTAAAVLTGKQGNKNYSPASLYMALAIAASGAKGETETQLLELLGADGRADWLADQTSRLYKLLYTENAHGRLKIANSIWADDSCALDRTFAHNAAKNLYASVYQEDLSSEETAKLMGQWVADNTGGSIAPEFQADQNSLLHILNTVWLQDEWMDGFSAADNVVSAFHAAGGDTHCEFMCRTVGSGSSNKGENYLSASLSLKNMGQMVFILLDEGVTTDDILSDAQTLTEALTAQGNRFGQVVWQVPKFSFNDKHDLADMLKALGASDAFDGSKADFSGISPDGLFISGVTQDTHIAIDENGVEASAFTDITMVGSAFGEDEVSFMALDRPFIYAIVSGGGVPLFIGVVSDPTAK